MTTILNQQNRNAGTYQGSLSQSGVSIPDGATTIVATLVMSQTEIDSTANQAAFSVEGDWGNGWELIADLGTWVGGGGVRPGATRQPPGFTYATNARPMPQDMRATITTNRRWSWGVALTVT